MVVISGHEQKQQLKLERAPYMTRGSSYKYDQKENIVKPTQTPMIVVDNKGNNKVVEEIRKERKKKIEQLKQPRSWQRLVGCL